MRLIVALGARPNIVKVAPLLPELARADVTCDVVFTGSRPVGTDDAPGELSFLGLAIPEPKWFLDIGAATDAVTIGRALEGFEAILAQDRPDAMMVVGDLNTTLAAALAAVKAGVAVIHLQAGFRCGDMRVPEEVNRVLISRVAAMHLTPTENTLANLEAEGIAPERIHFVGDPVAEAVIRTTDARPGLRTCARYGLKERAYVLGSFHRPENLESPQRLAGLVAGLGASPLPVLVLDASRFRVAVQSAGITVPSSVKVVDAVAYAEMLSLERDAAAVVTDSAGVQVEACMLGVPCVTVREQTEYSTTVRLGANRLVAADPIAIQSALIDAATHRPRWVPPKRWDRAVSDRVCRVIKRGVIPLA